DEIEHRAVSRSPRGTEGQAESGAKVIFELTGDGPFDRPVTGIVYARGHLICEQTSAVFEKLDGQHANIFERLENAAGGVFGGTLGGGIKARGRSHREAQNAVTMMVFNERVEGNLSAKRAHRKHRHFAGEAHETLKDKRHGGKFRLG